MAYPVTRSNSIQFRANDEKLAFAVVVDDPGYTFGLFRYANDSGWVGTVCGDTNGFIAQGLSNEDIMAYGSVANYIKAMFPKMQEKLAKYLGGPLVKPDQNDKPACVGYDLALDVDFDAATGTFRLNKEPPLSHAR